MADQSNIKQEINSAIAGLNLDNSVNQVDKGKLTYALNASVENFDATSVNYQNEPGNVLCLEFPENYVYIGGHFIPELNKHIIFLTNPETGGSEIGYMDNNDCIYHKYINAACLAFNILYPIHKVVHKITNCTTEIYWTDRLNPRRFLDLNNLPYKIQEGTDVCDNRETLEIDCNKLNVQPIFSIPTLEVVDVITGGNNIAGTVQFAVQYCDAAGDGYTSYYSVTNPTPLADPSITTANFNYPVGKSVILDISDIDVTGYFKYFNIAVIKTVNAITSVELVGTYFIDDSTKQITYSGQNVTQIKLTINDIFEKFPTYEIAEDVTAVQDVLVWKGLTSIDRINYQQIANKITLQWETWRIPNTEDYSDELNATNLRGYLRDEVYPFEIVFELGKGKQTDGFHIPGRVISFNESSKPPIPSTDADFIGTPNEDGTRPYWSIYNTATVLGTNPEYTPYSDYKGPYQYGDFAYWESTDVYPCNEDVWGELANKPIRHHKFPDVRISPIFENPSIETGSSGEYVNLSMQKNAIFPIGVKLDVQQVVRLIEQSSLTREQKDAITGFKIVRGDRSTNKSIVAKGILRNVGKYEREGTQYYFPNYPYNDLGIDPFILEKSNAYFAQCITYKITGVDPSSTYQYNDCYSNKMVIATINIADIAFVCSTVIPIITSGNADILPLAYDSYELYLTNGNVILCYTDYKTEQTVCQQYEEDDVLLPHPVKFNTKVGSPPLVIPLFGGEYILNKTGENITSGSTQNCYPNNLEAFTSDESKYRHVFNSPETSFGQPFLGDILKLENVVFGAGKAHFVEVKKNALYKLITKEAQELALKSSEEIANITSPFSATAMFTAYQSYLQIYINAITRINYGWSYNSIASYDYYSNIDNDLGIKQRKLDKYQYLIPGVQSLGESININNYERESSVYLRTSDNITPLPFPNNTPSLVSGGIPLIEDKSRYINSEKDCTSPNKQFDISALSYYASIKNIFTNQWGQMYSYNTIDTGFRTNIDVIDFINGQNSNVTIFGGDTFINKFSFKTKLPFFIDNRVGAPDDSDIFYDEIGNVAYPAFWHSSRSLLYDYTVTTSPNPVLKNVISVKAHNLDCSNFTEDVQGITTTTTTTTSSSGNPLSNTRMYYNGKMYMFAYGVPTFYCESSINVDLRQAFNNREGDFYPHVSTGIPDDWFQESFVTIAQDNTYYYNITYSKQNKENFFSHLPIDWTEQLCYTHFPFRAIYSDEQQSYTDNRINSWLIYRPISFFDFPQNYGKLTSLDGIQNKAILARFENKSLLYNTLLTINTSNPQAAYMGNDTLFKSSPPIDFAETDLGYVGSQNKMLLKIPQGQITIDAKRGQVFLIQGNRAQDLSGFGSGLNKFFKNHLYFEILNYFPNVDTDNHFNGIGLHGVYDSKYNRVIISKLDYIPNNNNILYDGKFYVIENKTGINIKKYVELTDTEYFCNKSWTLSFNMDTMTWISFHSYIPNFYIAENNFFYSGLNIGCDLEAIAFEIAIDCELSGIAVGSTTTTTTTAPPDCTLLGNAQQV